MLDAVATIILAGMMLIPEINLLVGIVAGGASFGVWEASRARRSPF